MQVGQTYASRIRQIVGGHARWRGEECLNLIPSENVTSIRVRRLLTSDMGHRYRADDRFYRGTKYLDEMELLAEELACRVFGADWASLRPLSGHMADMITVSTATKPGDSILMIDPDDGGYAGLGHQGGYTTFVGVRNHYFPFNRERMNIRVEESKKLILRERPRLVLFGQSYFLFPHPVKELAETCRSIGATIAFDASHVLGLIAGGRFQKPLLEGADLIIGSTHKSFFGPQGGIVLGKDSVREKVRNRQHPGLVDNAHWNRIAAMAWALDEMRRVGKEYASQVISNSKALAKALDDGKVPVKCQEHGFTESHQVMLDIKKQDEIDRLTERLEQANLIVDRAIRIGTNEMTRRGMKEKEMGRIGSMIVRVYNGESPEKVRREAVKLRKEFDSIEYT